MMDVNLRDLTMGFDEMLSKAGVIVGLLWGTVSVLLLYIRSLREGKPPDFDPCLPEDTPYHRWILNLMEKRLCCRCFEIFEQIFWVKFFWVDHTWSYLIHFTQGALPICLSPMTRDTIRNHIQLILPATRRYAMLDRWPSTLSSLASMILEEVEVCFWYLSCPNLILLVTIFLLVF